MLLETPINVIHKKTNNTYRIVGLVKQCTNANEGEIHVLYESQTTYKDVHFTREITEFIEKFECPDLRPHVKKFMTLLDEFQKPTVWAKYIHFERS